MATGNQATVQKGVRWKTRADMAEHTAATMVTRVVPMIKPTGAPAGLNKIGRIQEINHSSGEMMNGTAAMKVMETRARIGAEETQAVIVTGTGGIPGAALARDGTRIMKVVTAIHAIKAIALATPVMVKDSA